MPRLTTAQKQKRRIEQLEKTRIVVQSKIAVLTQSLDSIEAELKELTSAK
ncbi:hypothetical protein [Spirosoma fluminis]